MTDDSSVMSDDFKGEIVWECMKVSTKDLLECVAINNVMKDWLNTTGVDVGLWKHVL